MTIYTRYIPHFWDSCGCPIPIDPNLDLEGKCQEVIDLMLQSGRIAPDTSIAVRYGIAMSEVLHEGFESVIDGLVLQVQAAAVDAAAESERAVMMAANAAKGEE